MTGKLKGLTVEIDGDVTKLSKAITSVNSDAKKLQTELRGITRLLKYDPKNVALLEQKQRKLNQALDEQAQKLKMLRKAEEEYNSTAEHTDEQIKDFENLQRDIVATQKSLEAAKRALAEFNIEQGVSHSLMGKLGSGIESFGRRVKPIGDHMESIGRGLTRTVTPAVVMAGAASVAAAVDIDTALTGVKKTVDGTEEQYQELKQAAIDFSQTNAVSASQILDIQALGAQLGFAIDELDEFGRVVSGLDIATNMDAETAASEMAHFANITKMGHDEISNYGSAIVGLGNNFATTESDISSMAMRIAAAGTQVGMSQADVLGLATALSSMGVEAEAGGTAISTIMSQIDKDVARAGDVMAETSDLAQGEADKVVAALQTWADAAGTTAEDFANAWKKDPVSALSDLFSGMEAATTEGSNMSLMLDDLGIESLRQTDVMKRLAGNSELVGQAVAKSNEEWGKNTALQKEVDNRNDSLAAKFEILKNRVIAVADDVGGPLADALLDIVDQAEPLIKMIADGAKQFSEMSKEEQGAVLQAVALSAAIGPMLTLFGKGVKSIEPFGVGLQKIARFFATVDQNTSEAGRSIKNYTADAKKSETAVKKQTDTIKKSSVAMGAAKSAAAGLAMAGIALVIAQIVKYIDHQLKFDKATKGLEDAMGSMNAAYLSSRDAVKEADDSSADYVKSLSDVRAEVDRVIEKQAELADSIKTSFEEAGADICLLDSYKDIIGELAGKSDLSAEKQAELEFAIRNVNEQCGTNYEVVKDAGGAYVVMEDGAVKAKDAILKLIEAQEMQIRFDAGKEAYEQSFKLQADAARAAADATAAYNEIVAKHDEKIRQITDAGGDYAHALTVVQSEEDAARRKMEEANEALSTSRDAMSLLRDEQALLSQALNDGAGSISEYVGSNDFLLASLEGAGKSCLDFAGTLQGVGANVTDLGRLNEEQLSTLAENYNGTYSSIAGLLGEYGVHVDDAMVKSQIAFDGITNSLTWFEPQVKNALLGAGTNADEFARKLADAGVSTEDFSKLSASELANLVSSYNGSIEITKAKLDEFVKNNHDAGASATESLASGIESGKEGVYASAVAVGKSAPSGLATGINGSTAPGDAAASLGGTVSGTLGSSVGDVFGIGAGIGADYAFGIGSQSGNASGQGSVVAKGATSGLGTGDANSGTKLGSQFAKNVGDQASNAKTKGTFVAANAKSGMGSVSAGGAGTNFVRGFVNGFYGVSVWDAAYRIGMSALGAIKSALGIASPSKEAQKLSDYLVDGFILPMDSRRDEAYRTGYELARSAYDGMGAASSIGIRPSYPVLNEPNMQAVIARSESSVSAATSPVVYDIGDVNVYVKEVSDVDPVKAVNEAISRARRSWIR